MKTRYGSITYHIGLLKSGDKVIVQMRRDVDCLDPETWRYLGIRNTTKKAVKHNRADLLSRINAGYDNHFTRITID